MSAAVVGSMRVEQLNPVEGPMAARAVHPVNAGPARSTSTGDAYDVRLVPAHGSPLYD